MQTQDLIAVMTADNQRVDTTWLGRATWLAALTALGLTIVLVLVTLGPRRDLADASMTVPVFAKAALGASLAAVALCVFQVSLRPGLKSRLSLSLALLPLAFVAGWALLTLAQAPAESWSGLIFGRNWRACLIAVPAYSVVPFVILLGLARRGAPVDGRVTGASIGMASAGLAIIGYSLHCPDDTVPFLATWYPSALAIVTLSATVIAPRFLRW